MLQVKFERKYMEVEEKDIFESIWEKVSYGPSLSSLVAINPISGLEEYSFDKALVVAKNLFEVEPPEDILEVNLHSIKWCQALLTTNPIISPIYTNKNIYEKLIELLLHDNAIHKNNKNKIKILEEMPENPLRAIMLCLNELRVAKNKVQDFLESLLLTLPGWAAFVKTNANDFTFSNNLKIDFLCLRVLCFLLLNKNPEVMLDWIAGSRKNSNDTALNTMLKNEVKYQSSMISKFGKESAFEESGCIAPVQFLFCIDVRSEPVRSILEKNIGYETYGVAGFFAAALKVQDENVEKNNCPIILQPKNTVKMKNSSRIIAKISTLAGLYSKVKYNFTSCFAAAEILGIFSIVSMLSKSFMPRVYDYCRNLWRKKADDKPYDISEISLSNKVDIAKNMLASIGLVKNFSKYVVICGHKSTTTNNIFSSSLQCGACGGHSGYINAKVVSDILNDFKVRENLIQHNIIIPKATHFIAAFHDTTANTITLNNTTCDKNINSMQDKVSFALSKLDSSTKAYDWSEVRAEWGLSKNASFIIGPRSKTKNINLDGRAFLHSYNSRLDDDGSILNSILSGPGIVAYWINMQYNMSCLNNQSYGAGSKVSSSVIDDVSISQGCFSDLMYGLPLQSIKISHDVDYHAPARLTLFIFAPKNTILKVVKNNSQLNNLISKSWLQLICIEGINKECFKLDTKLHWNKQQIN